MSDLLLKSKLLFKVLSIFGVISILICLSSITILHIVINLDHHKPKLIQSLIYNSYDKPIQDIIYSPNKDCYNPYTTLVFDKWEGLLKVCSNDECYYDTGNLNNSLIEKSSVNIKIWNKNQFCVSFLDLSHYTLVGKDEQCPINQKRCGYLDNNTILCSLPTYLCPINYINIQNNRSEYSNDTNIKLENNKTLVVSREKSNGLILNSFKISEGPPCIDNHYKNLLFTTFPSDPYFYRTKCPIQFNEEIEDKTYNLLDSGNYLELLIENNIFKRNDSFLIENNTFNHNINLYTKMGYLGINSLCFQKINFYNQSFSEFIKSRLSRIQNDINSIPNSKIELNVALIISYFIILTTLMYVIIICVSLNCKPQYYILLYFILAFLLKVIIVFTIYYGFRKDFIKYLSEITDNPSIKCLEDSFNLELEIYIKSNKNEYFLLNISLLIYLSSLALDGIFILIVIPLFYLFKKKRSYAELKDEERYSSQISSSNRHSKIGIPNININIPDFKN